MSTVTPTSSAVLGTVEALGPPGTPVTTPEVAERFDCTNRTVYNRLQALVDEGTLETKKVGARGRVWWLPADVSDGDLLERTDESQELLALAIEVGELGVWELDLRTNESPTRSLRHDQIFGYDEPVPDWSYERFLEHVHPDDRRTVQDQFDEATRTGTWTFETRIERVDGEQRWIAGRGTFEYDDDEPVRAIGTVQDVTERKRLERDLRTEKEQMELAVESSPLVLFRLDTDLRYTWIKSPAPDFDAAAVIGLRDDDLLPPEAAEIILAPKRRALETGERVREEVTYELPSGEVTYDLTVDPLRDESGEVVELSCASVDVTDRKRREEQLRERAELDAFRVGLTDAIRPITDPVAIQHEAARFLGDRLGVDRAHYGEVLADENTNVVHADYYRGDVASVVGEYRLDGFGEYLREAFRSGETLVVEDYATVDGLSETERAAYLAIDIQAYVGVPLVKDGRLTAYFVVTQSTTRAWTDTEIAMIEETAERTWAAVERAHAEQALERTNDALERLNAASRELMVAEPPAIRDAAARLVQHVLDVEYAALWRYDETVGELRQHASHTDPATGGDARAYAYPDGFETTVWNAFVGDEVDVSNDLPTPESPVAATPLRSSVLVPLGRHGVVCAGATQPNAFDERTIEFAETIAATLETAWNRAESEQVLAKQNAELQRLDRLNGLIRTIDQALVNADTRAAIDQAVCERLSNSDLYEFAWIGDRDPDSDRVQPRVWAGIDSNYLAAVTTTDEDLATSPDPVAQAARTGQLQVVHDVATDSGFAPWRAATLERGGRSLVSIPLIYDESVYGVLSVYAGHPQADERDLDVLAELGTTIAHAINARETSASLQTDSVVELTLRFRNANTPLVRLARETNGAIEYQGFVRRPDGDVDVFFLASGVPAADLQAAGERLLAFRELTCLTEGTDEALFRARVADPTLASLFADEGAVVRSLAIDDGVATVVADVSNTAAVREVLDGLRQHVPDLDLIARHSRERPLKTSRTFVATVEDRLTPRQRDVLQTAYLSGYFESPRVSSGQEVTALLGISQPTFSEHLRAAERTLCELLFDGE